MRSSATLTTSRTVVPSQYQAQPDESGDSAKDGADRSKKRFALAEDRDLKDVPDSMASPGSDGVSRAPNQARPAWLAHRLGFAAACMLPTERAPCGAAANWVLQNWQ